MKNSHRSVPDMFLDRVESTPDRQAFLYPSDGSWATLTWRETGDRVRSIACGLRALGLGDEERCAIMSSTRIDWVLADLAILCAGGATTTIYPSSTADDTAYILADSGTVFVFAEDEAQVAKLVKERAGIPNVKRVITFDGGAKQDGWVISLAELEDLGRKHDAEQRGRYEEIARAVRTDSLATLIYTSGTTGRPKGVELIHDCWVYEAEAIDELKLLTADDRQYFWLPLAHSFGKVLEAAQLRIGFVTAIDGRIEKLVENLAVVKPTIMAAVPRIFEKVHNKVLANAREGSKVKARIFAWAFRVGHEVSRLRQEGREPGGFLAFKFRIANKLVFSKLKARFGGRVRYFVSGAAPLSREIAEFFHAADILILEGYGLTETSAASFVNRPDSFRFGTVGPPLPGTEVRISDADSATGEGEVLIKGRGVMRGYHNLPEESREALDADGWCRTGDIGKLDEKGRLQITDRKKDLIKTSGGKYVAPQAIEGKFKAICPLVSQMIVHGNNRNFCSALIALDEEALRKFAADRGLGEAPYADLAARPEVKEAIQGYVDQLNASLASYESIRKFAILPADLTVEGGDLTPSQKLKRKTVEQRYRALLDSFYESARAAG